MTERFIDFYFDFISPYGYFAAMQIEAVAQRHGYAVRWHVFRVGVAVVKVMGLRPLMETPLKGSYVLHDVQRLSSLFGVPITQRRVTPDPVLLGSAFHAVKKERAHCLAPFAKQLYTRIWRDGESMTSVSDLHGVTQGLDINAETVFSPLAMEQGRGRLAEATTSALSIGVFGSPTFRVNDELIWGVDRIWMLEHYLRHGEWLRDA